MPQPGDVLLFVSSTTSHAKFHLCVRMGGAYLLINSPKDDRSYEGDFVIPCSDLPFLDPTPSGHSIISCNLVLRISDAALRRLKPVHKGTCGSDLLARLMDFVAETDALTEEERELVLSGLDGWVR